MACGICKKEGHNRRTCSQRDKNETLNTNTTRKFHSTSSTSTEIYEEIERTVNIGQDIKTDLRDLKEILLKKRFLTQTTNNVETRSVDSTAKSIVPVLLKEDAGNKILPTPTHSRKKLTKQWLNSEALKRLDQGIIIF